MKYYVYISDAKVDMLLPQIPQESNRRTATELKVDLKLVGLTRKYEKVEENRITRLEALVKHICSNEDVGTVDEPGQFVQDILDMYWGPLDSVNSPIVYFCGRTSQTDVGLAGSMKHVIGNVKDQLDSGYSLLPTIFYHLSREVDHLDGDLDVDNKRNLRQVARVNENIFHSMRGNADGKFPGNPVERLEFLARRLAYDGSVLIATPLYVALAE